MRWFSLKILVQNGVLGGALLTVAALLLVIRHQPSLGSVRAAHRASDRAILDRNGELVDEIRDNGQDPLRRLNWVEYQTLPQEFIDSVLAAQDRRFFYHLGFEPGGGETITMQLLDQIAPHPQAGRIERILRSVALEMAWKKREILEAYVNLAVYRGELQGVAAASRALFDKAPEKLTRPESAVLAALIHHANAPIPIVQSHACRLLAVMDVPFECTEISPGHLVYLEESYRIRPFLSLAPFAAERLAHLKGLPDDGLVRSTLDRQLQWQTLHSVQSVSDEAAAIIIDNATGNVLAYVSATRSDDQVKLGRQASASFLPLIYAQALDERVVTASTLVDEHTVREALRERLTLPSVQVLDELGVENFVQSLGQNGFTGMSNADLYGPSLALGGAEVPLVEVANAYRTLANGGEWSPLRFSPDEVGREVPRHVWSPEAAFLVTDILSEQANGRSWRAVLESETMTVGFSERYTIGVVGPRSLWNEIADRVEPPPTDPLAAVTDELAAPESLLKVNEEWYIAGTEPQAGERTPTVASTAMPSFIAFPKKGAVIALEETESRLRNEPFFIQIAGPQPDQNVYLNGHRLGRATPRVPWQPQSGHFHLELRNSRGQILHQVDFEVRGRRFAGIF